MKYLSIIKYVLLVVSAVLIVFGAVTFTEGAETNSAMDTMLIWSAVMVLLTIALVVVMPIIALAQNPKGAKRSLLGIVLVAVVFLVSYALASDEPITLASGKVMDNAGELIFSDTALWATYITFGAVILSILGGEIYKLLKK